MRNRKITIILSIIIFCLAVLLSNNVYAEEKRTFGIQASRQGGSYAYIKDKYVYIELRKEEEIDNLYIDNRKVISKTIDIYTDVMPKDGVDDFTEMYAGRAIYEDSIKEYVNTDVLDNGWAKYTDNGIVYKCQYVIEYKYDYLKNLVKHYSYIFKRDNGAATVSNVFIWNLYEKVGEEKKYSNSIYCLRGGYGFHGMTDQSQETFEEYNNFLDMKSEKTEVQEALEDNNGLKENDNNYKAVLWLIDNMYLSNCIVYKEDDTIDIEKTEETRIQLRTNLLAEAFKEKEEFIKDGKVQLDEIRLSDDDIEVIQQLAIWYFTNGYNQTNTTDASYKIVADSFAIYLKNTDMGDFEILSNLRKDDTDNGEAKWLYDYLIRTANEKATSGYTDTTKTALDISLTKDNAKIKDPIGNIGQYLAGPFTITYNKGNSDFEANIEKKITTKNNIELKNIGKIVIKNNNNAYEEKSIKEIIQIAIDNTETKTAEFFIQISESELYNSNIRSNQIPQKINLSINIKNISINTKATFCTSNIQGDVRQPLVIVEKVKLEPITLKMELIKEKEFDLALRKYITKVIQEDGTEVVTTGRTPEITGLKNLVDETATTAIYTHNKTTLAVKKGDTIIYEIRVYNEGEVDGFATKIEDYLPEGLKLVKNSEINTNNGWIENAENSRIVTTEKLKDKSIVAFNRETEVLSYVSVQIECMLDESVEKGIILTNIAQISSAKDANGNIIEKEFDDRDSIPNNVKKPTDENLPTYKENQQDDDDYEKIIIETEPFDLALRKFISKINDIELVEEDSRVPTIDITKLKEGKSTTSIYSHSKIPVKVQKGDVIEYTLRVYNEGQIDGYASEIIDYLPEGLGLIVGYRENSWIKIPEDAITKATKEIFGVRANSLKLELNEFVGIEKEVGNVNVIVGPQAITTEGLKNKKITKFNGTTLDYKDITVTCVVLTEDTDELIRNIAEISKARSVDEKNETTNTIDIDSNVKNVDTNEYTPPVDNSTYQQDDDDYEVLSVQYFDLALRKFITKVNTESITTRIPKFVVDKTTGKITYEHDKTPLYVANNDIVEYTIRVYNEGKIDGYAEEIMDNIPKDLVYLPDNQTNKENGWKMYFINEKKEVVETDDVTKATIIKTNNLSKTKGTIIEEITETEDNGQKVKVGKEVNSNLIKSYKKGSADEPSFKEVRVAFRVSEEKLPEDRIIINKAEIYEDSDFDIDSTPNNSVEKEDDIDKEYLYVKYFDLSLLKWVSKAIVTVNGEKTITETGYNGLENPEPIVKVDVKKNKIKTTNVKFVYTIKITNEGEIAGYAKEITDYIPTGLKFVADDNPDWKKENDEKITTTKLSEILLQPKETATVDVTFTWINGENNIGVKTNVAEISEDDNQYDAEDIDSIPDNKKEGEDDIDKALVMLAISTGSGRMYISLIITILSMLAGGIYLIKRYVIE